MLRSIFGFDWKKSQSHLLLLSKFIHAQDPDIFSKYDIWESVLNEKPLEAIKRFQKEGFITIADLESTLSYKYRLTDLKALLKQYRVPISGRKEDLVKRFIATDLDGAKKLVANITVFQCTQIGREIAEKYLEDEQEKRSQAEVKAIEFIKLRRFREASITVSKYESEQVIPRGIGVDWKNHDPNRDIEILSAIFDNKPKILSQLNDEEAEILREGAAMMVLWGKNTAHEWLAKDIKIAIPFDVDTTARMFFFHATYKVTLNQYRQDDDVVKFVEIHSAQDACEECSKFTNKRYNLYEVPELPHSNCTHKKGCRCVLIPVVL